MNCEPPLTRSWQKSRAEMESKKKDSALVRSSAAEYLTFVASTGEDKDSIEMRYED